MIKNQYRFFIESKKIQGNQIIINDKDLIHQITKVLRLRIGEQIILLDNSGFEYLVNLEKVDDVIKGFVVEKSKNESEPNKKIILCQSLLKSDKFEQVLKFCTNLGVSEFIPFVSDNSIIKEVNLRKIERYQKIIKESAEQSGRGILPKLEKLMNFNELLDFLKRENFLKFIGWEQEKERGLIDFKEKIKKSEKVYILIGPEGGFNHREISLALKSGCLSFSLGRLVLRSEIAGLIATALILS